MTEKLFLIIMVVLALISLNTQKLRRAVVYLGIFSLTSSFVYLLYGAPDVAIAEAVIGSTITTVLYLVALRNYQVFTIFYANDHAADLRNIKRIEGDTSVLKKLEDFLTQREIEPQIIFSGESLENILKHENFDLVIYQTDKNILAYGCAEDYQIDAIEEYFKLNHEDLNINFMRFKEGEKNEA